jgi:uncharacterized damage-inducible protein DinB
MKTSEVLHLYSYTCWATARILRTAARVTPDVLAKPAGLAHGSMLGTLAHILGGEWVWRVRCEEGRSPGALLSAREFPDLAALERRWSGEERAMRRYLAGLSDAGLERVVRYRSTLDNREYATPLWQVLLHLVNHGTQHRGEVAAELTRAGHSPGDIDYIVYIRSGGEMDFSQTQIAGGDQT